MSTASSGLRSVTGVMIILGTTGVCDADREGDGDPAVAEGALRRPWTQSELELRHIRPLGCRVCPWSIAHGVMAAVASAPQPLWRFRMHVFSTGQAVSSHLRKHCQRLLDDVGLVHT